MNYAVVKTGGKQYKVAEDEILRIEKIDADAGQIVTLNDILLVSVNDNVSVGSPLVDGASVAVEILAQRRARKVIIFKKRRRKSSQRKRGHRQSFTLIRISEILVGGAKPTKAAQGMPEKVIADIETSLDAQESVKTASKPAKAKKAEKGDDIKLLSGVGPALAKKLNDAGIVSFAQIADLSADEIAKLDEELNLGGRFEREEWQAQARELMAGKAPRAKSDREDLAKSNNE
jgi:large subunit ribosomal protein L21